LIIPNGSVSKTGDAAFTVTGGTCLAGASLAQNTGTCTVIVNFAPTTAGVKTGNLVIAHNDQGLQTNIPLSGTGTVPVASVSPVSPFGFPNPVQVGIAAASAPTQVFTLTNSGDGILTIPAGTAGINVSGASFTRVAGGCGATLAAGANCAITVRFLLTFGGNVTGALTITSNNNGIAGTVMTVLLNGTDTISATNDVQAAIASSSTAANVVQFIPASLATGINVRVNDLPPNAGTVAIVSSVTFSPAAANNVPGASATAITSIAVTLAGATTGTLTHVRFQVTPSQTAGLTNAQRQLSKRGTYVVTYRLTNGTATADATVTATLN